jgi:hypothetical protein
MSIQCVCPGCRSVFHLPDNLLGKTVRCQACQAEFQVEDDSEDRGSRAVTARRRAPATRDEGAYEEPRRPGERRGGNPTRGQPKKSKLPLILGLSIGGVLLLGGVGVGLVLLLSGKGKSKGDMPPPRYPDRLIKTGFVQIPLPASYGDIRRLYFPGAKTHQVVIHSRGGVQFKERFDRFDLDTGESLGSAVLDRQPLLGDVSVSPDGTRLAYVKNNIANEVSVWSFPDNQEVIDKFVIDGSALQGPFMPGRILISLLENDRLLVAHGNGARSLFNLKERREIYSVAPTPNPGERISLNTSMFKRVPLDHALSPDRKLLAFRRGSGFELVDTATGKTVRQLDDSKAAGGLAQVWTVAFNPDSNDLLAYYEAFPEKSNVFKRDPPVLKRWDVKTGKETDAISLPSKFLFNRSLTWWGNDSIILWNDNLTEGVLVNYHKGQYLRHLKTHTPGCCGDASPDRRLWVVTTHHPARFGQQADSPTIFLTGIDAPEDKELQAPTKMTNAISQLGEWYLTPDGIEDQARQWEQSKQTD